MLNVEIGFCLLCCLVCSRLIAAENEPETCSLGESRSSCSDLPSHAEKHANANDFLFEDDSREVEHSIWSKESSQAPVDQPKNQEKTTKWSKYYDLINKALCAYIPCDSSSKSALCFADVLRADLRPYQTSLGVTKNMIETARLRGVLYQIIDHKLYRQKDCLFPSRCSGVEHFLLQLVKDLPDMEFVVNVSDYPQVSVHEPHPFPVLSFSKTPDFQDILYPAWTFWEGGPAIASYPRGLGRWDLMRDEMDASADKFPWNEKEPIGFFAVLVRVPNVTR